MTPPTPDSDLPAASHSQAPGPPIAVKEANPSSTTERGTSAQRNAAEAVPPPSPVPPNKVPARRWRRPLWVTTCLIALLVAGSWLFPRVMTALNTVSTDDAYVNGHVTFVAPRVGGQVARVLVEDNNRVRKGDLLVQLDKEPFLVQLSVAQSAVDAARSDLVAAQAQVRAAEGQVRSLRFSLDHAIQEVDNQIALLRAKVAALNSRQAALVRAQSDFDRADKLRDTGAVSPD